MADDLITIDDMLFVLPLDFLFSAKLLSPVAARAIARECGTILDDGDDDDDYGCVCGWVVAMHARRSHNLAIVYTRIPLRLNFSIDASVLLY